MSTASKVTFAGLIVFAAGAFVFINWSQGLERNALRQGPIKDAARMEAKRTKKMMVNEAEHQEQAALREKLHKLQPLSDEIIRGEDKPQL